MVVGVGGGVVRDNGGLRWWVIGAIISEVKMEPGGCFDIILMI